VPDFLIVAPHVPRRDVSIIPSMDASANMKARVPRSSGRLLGVVPFALTAAAALVFSFLSGGYVLGRSSPVAIVYLLLAAAWVWLLRRRSRPPLLVLAGLLVFGLFVAWSGLSVLWSFGPDLSWISFNLAAFYLVVVTVLCLTPARGLHLRVAGYGFFAVAVAVGVYAFFGKGIPDVVAHAHTYARLDSPIGYWNVLALMMVMGLLVALALAGDRTSRAGWRVLAAAGAVPLCFTFFFTFSRGGWVVLAVALLLYFAFTTTRLASLASLVAIVVPVAAVLWRLRGLQTLFEATTNDTLRTVQGHALLRWAVAAVLVASAAQVVIVIVHRGVPWPRWLRIVAGAAVLVVLAGGFGIGSWRFVEARGGASWVSARVQAFTSDSDATSSANEAGRLVSVNTGRPPLWRETLKQSHYDRIAGTGAGTFPFTHYRFRKVGGVVKHAHSEWFNVLSELGVVGLVLFVTALALLAAAAIRNPFAGRADPLRPLVVAMQAGILAFIVHISWDWDWDMAAIGTVFFLFVGVCASYLATQAHARRRAAEAATLAETAGEDRDAAAGESRDGGAAPIHKRPRRRAVTWPLRVVATTALVVLAVSWVPPYLSARAENAALAASSDGDSQVALRQTRRAARLDPLAVSPLITEALVLQQEGQNREALAALRKAQRLQPDDFEVYYQLGVLQLKAFARKGAAVADFKRALGLNPADIASQYELGLALGE
jgi:tetratricopeptide (TPR) repeat protein